MICLFHQSSLLAYWWLALARPHLVMAAVWRSMADRPPARCRAAKPCRRAAMARKCGVPSSCPAAPALRLHTAQMTLRA